MAEDDDDDFGDFEFAPSHPNPTVTSHQINGWSFPSSAATTTTTTTTNINDDDEWGDFFHHSSTKTLSSSQSLPNFSNASTAFDPFGFSTEQVGNSRSPGSVTSHAESVPGRIESEKSHWTKLQGALPLSIFGEEETEEEPAPVVDASLFPPKTGDSAQKGPNLNAGVGLNDLIANLYTQSHQIKPENGLNPNSNGLDLNTNESNTGFNGPSLDVKELNTDSNGLNLKSNGLNQDLDDGNEDASDDDGWEFKVAEAETGARDATSEIKGDQMIAENGFDLNFTGSNLSRSGLSSDLSGLDLSFVGSSSSTNGLNSNLTDGKEDVNGFGAWEFKGVQSESWVGDGNPKVDENRQQSSGGAENTFDVVSAASGPSDLFGASGGTSNKSGEWDFGFDFNPNFTSQDGISSSYSINKHNDTANGINSSLSVDKVDSDEFIWEFKDASSKDGSTDKLEDPKVADVLPASVNALAVGNTANAPNGSIVASNGVSHGSDQLDFGFSFSASSGTKDGSDLYKSKQNGNTNDLISTSVDTNVKYEESFWGFKGAFPESGSKHQITVDDKQKLSENGLDSNAFSSHLVNGGHDVGHNSWEFKGAFSEVKAEEQTSMNAIPKIVENGLDSTNVDDDFGVDSWEFKGAFSGTSTKEQAFVNDTQKNSENRSDSTQTGSKPNLVNGHDILWDFDDAFMGSKAEDQTSGLSCKDSFKRHSTTLELNNYVDLYGKMKDELCYIAQCHLNNIKKAQRNGAPASEDAKIKDLDDVFQELYNELCEDNMINKELHSEDCSEGNSCLNELLEVVKEPMYQMLESEYHLSERLSMAAKDLKSTIELLKHVLLTLKILSLGSADQQFNYVSTWYKIISVCAEELEHGASVWKQTLQKSVQNQILSGSQGKRYILSLGEIYRVVEVLGASARLYKPWILLCSANPTDLFALLSKCSTLWSSSGVEEALQSICDPIDFGYDGTVSALQASINSIHDLDVLTLQNHVLPQQEPICRLSLLSPKTILDMKLVVWNGEHYFLKVANLWANLVSRDPPDLPHIQVG